MSLRMCGHFPIDNVHPNLQLSSTMLYKNHASWARHSNHWQKLESVTIRLANKWCVTEKRHAKPHLSY